VPATGRAESLPARGRRVRDRPVGPRPHLREDLRELRATLLVVTALIAALGVAVIIGVLVHGSSRTGDVAVTEVEYHITVPAKLHAGRHTFAVKNRGTEPHELVVVRTDVAAAALPRAGAKVDETSSRLHVTAATGALAPGATRSVSVTLTPGHYVVLCDLPSHYGLGMRVDIAVSN
jgi:uncharacterized cupredoxin-like copper-binding protein